MHGVQVSEPIDCVLYVFGHSDGFFQKFVLLANLFVLHEKFSFSTKKKERNNAAQH
jgi:hypothetical protein